MPNILILDIETAPKVAYVWRFWQENVSAKQVLEHGHIMSFAAKWLGKSDVFYSENRGANDVDIIQHLISYLDSSDMVVAHNGGKFDVPQIRARALVHGIKPPSPFKVIDTCKIARKEFGFPSNSLEYLCEVLDTKIKKDGHKKFPGFQLWLECLRNNDEAWEEMKYYNIQDVLALEEVYLKMRPWMVDHPNVAVYDQPAPEENDEVCLCPKCGADNVQYRGYAYTQTAKYHRYQCNNCGGWGRTRYQLNSKNLNLLGSLVS